MTLKNFCMTSTLRSLFQGQHEPSWQFLTLKKSQNTSLLNVWRELDLKESIFIFAANQFDLEDAIQKVVSNKSSIVVSTSDFQPQIKANKTWWIWKKARVNSLTRTITKNKAFLVCFFFFLQIRLELLVVIIVVIGWTYPWLVEKWTCTNALGKLMRKKENFHSTIFKNKAFLVSFLQIRL